MQKIPALTFHKVDRAFEWGVTRVTPRQFLRMATWLRDQGYSTVLPWEMDSPSLPEKPVLITFDDAYESVYTEAFPVLRELGMRATVFVVSGYVGRDNGWDVNLGGLRFRHASWDQLKALRDAGWEIGSHTVHHPDLTRVPDETVMRECRLSRSTLEETLGQPVTALSPPFGRYNERVLEAAVQAGYRRVCAFWRNRAAENCKEAFVIERKACYLFDTLQSLSAKCADDGWGRLESIKLRVINFFSHGTALVKPARHYPFYSTGK